MCCVHTFLHYLRETFQNMADKRSGQLSPLLFWKRKERNKTTLVLFLSQLRVLEMISAASFIIVETEAWSCEALKPWKWTIFGTMINTRMLTFSLLQNKLVTCISAPHQVCKVLLVGDPQEIKFNLVPGCLSLLPTCVWLCAIYC